MAKTILVLNSGSSSLKFGLFKADNANTLSQRFRGAVVHIKDNPHLTVTDVSGSVVLDRSWTSTRSETDLLHEILQWADSEADAAGIAAIGHRIVHGGSRFVAPMHLTERIIAELALLTPMAPLHQESCLSPARSLLALRPDCVQIGCFDTAFHAGLSPPASRFPIPRRFEEQGVRRYGFHGLSFEYIASRLGTLSSDVADQRTVVAHLGSGASLCAMRGGRSMDTTMGLTPLDGLMMGTRSGSIDPGIILYLQRDSGMSAQDIENTLYHESGLLGVSGISGDMQNLLASEQPHAAEAIDLFCLIAAKQICAMACTLGGLDSLIFTGGIGEHAAKIRDTVCTRLRWLGVELNDGANDRAETLISASGSKVEVRIIKTNEEAMIAKHVDDMIG